MSGPGVNVGDEDRLADFDGDGGVDLHDLAGFATDGHQRANRTGTAPERRRALSEPPAPGAGRVVCPCDDRPPQRDAPDSPGAALLNRRLRLFGTS